MTKYFYTLEAMLPNDITNNCKQLIINGIKKDNIMILNHGFSTNDEALNHATKQQTDPKLTHTLITVYSVGDNVRIRSNYD